MYAHASASPISMSELKALRAAGRFIVTMTICPSCSTVQCGVLIGSSSAMLSPRSGAGPERRVPARNKNRF
jgi:hypothetical protein